MSSCPLNLPSICSNMLLKVFVEDFSSVIVFFGFKKFFMFSVSSLSFSFCSYIIFLVASNCLSVFFYNPLSICRAIIFNYLLGNSWISICLVWIWGLPYSFDGDMLSWLFVIPVDFCRHLRIWRGSHLHQTLWGLILVREACHLWKGEHQVVWWPLV